MSFKIWVTRVLLYSAAWTISAVIAKESSALAPTAVADWSEGEISWQQASHLDDEKDLWSELNACDARVLHSSAPLTVLFGISKLWSEIGQQRAATQKAETAFEVHVLGAAYPFEGRSDWSLFSSRRPKNVAKVRIVLILGTPWHSDNVPVMHAKEFDEDQSLLQRTIMHKRKPVSAKWTREGLSCSKNSLTAKQDKTFTKAELCRDHGNGLEVVCIEKYYQDVADTLPSPDVVAMFSPGFPQLARRSWDEVLRRLLLKETPVMVCDLLTGRETVFKDSIGNLVAPGQHWRVEPRSAEDGMTFRTLQAYGARVIGSFRNPFPIFNRETNSSIIAKNAVLQLFQGRHGDAQPFEMLSKKDIHEMQQGLKSLDLKEYFKNDDQMAKEVKRSLLIPTSSAYNHAMQEFYLPGLQDRLRDFVEACHNFQGCSESDKAKLQELGLTPSDGQQAEHIRLKSWGWKDWIFILEHLKGEGSEIF